MMQGKTWCPIPRWVALQDFNLSKHPGAPASPQELFVPLTEKEAIRIEKKGGPRSKRKEMLGEKWNERIRTPKESTARKGLTSE